MGSNALKATILDRGHAKEASKGVEAILLHKAQRGRSGSGIRQLIRQPVAQRPGPPVWPDSAFLPPLEPL